MTKEALYKACKKYADEYVEKHMVMPKTPSEVADWNKANFLDFRTRASKVVSQVEIDLKSAASKASDKVYEELILSVGGEKV
jgi:hypothetical protein